MKVSNKDARQLVENRQAFKGNNTFAEGNENFYKVYSYGYHFPIYCYKNGAWYRNINKYSVTTSKHQSQLKPLINDFIELNTEAMQAL